MDFGKIIGTGFRQAWQHKSLWIFGLLISGGGSGISNLSNRLGLQDRFGMGRFHTGELERLFFDNILFILAIAALVLLLIMIFWILGTISVGGLVHAARTFREKRPFSFGECFGVGVKRFWPLFGLSLLAFIVIGAFVIITILIAVAAFVMHVGLGLMSLIILVPLLIIGIFVSSFTIAMAERLIVTENKPVFDSIGDGFTLWKSQLGSSLLYALIYFGIALGIGMSSFVVMIFVIMPFVAIGFINMLAAFLLGVPVVLLIMLIINGFTGASMHLMTTEFFYQLKGEAPAGDPVPNVGYVPPTAPPGMPPTDSAGSGGYPPPPRPPVAPPPPPGNEPLSPPYQPPPTNE